MLLFILMSCIACSDEEIKISNEPKNLVIDVRIENETDVILQASAENTVNYEFRLGSNEEPEEINSTGDFQHTYYQEGDYKIDVRAVGALGRYLREIIHVQIVFSDNDVDVNQGYTTPMEYKDYQLIWNDEFDGSSINNDYWVFETGTGCPHLCGWGNNEWQYYREQNAWVEDGVLTIEARKENFDGSQYTSTRMKTQGKKSFQYGRVDIRALLPKGQGIWPALWMLGNDITSVGWPACGEIDIMEMIGGSGRENTTHGTLHWDNGGHVYTGSSYTLDNGVFADEYHVFTIIWDESSIRWFVNDIEFHEILITPTHMTEFHQEFFFIFNVAVGGYWPGYPDHTTVFPQQMRVDYIRVFQKDP